MGATARHPQRPSSQIPSNIHTGPPGPQGQPDARVEHLQEHPLHGQLHAVVVPSLPGLAPLSVMILEGTDFFLVLHRRRSLTDLAAEAADVLPALAGRRLVGME